MHYLITAFGLTIGNFVYQMLVNGDWHVAADRSFFQVMAVIACWTTSLWLK